MHSTEETTMSLPRSLFTEDAPPRSVSITIPNPYGRFTGSCSPWSWLGRSAWLAFVEFDLGENITVHVRIPGTVATKDEALAWIDQAYQDGPAYLVPALEASR